jgi:hypothetical protein
MTVGGTLYALYESKRNWGLKREKLRRITRPLRLGRKVRRMCWTINGKTFDKMYDAEKYVLELACQHVPVTITREKMNKLRNLELNTHLRPECAT